MCLRPTLTVELLVLCKQQQRLALAQIAAAEVLTSLCYIVC
jgi:hypothetical protein